MLEYWRNDFKRVHAAMKMLTNNKMPDWAIVIWYIALLPFGLLLMPFAWIYIWYVKRQIGKLEK